MWRRSHGFAHLGPPLPARFDHRAGRDSPPATHFAEPSSMYWGGTFPRQTAKPVVCSIDTEKATATQQSNRGLAVSRATHGVLTLWYGDFWAKITTLTGPPVETKGR